MIKIKLLLLNVIFYTLFFIFSTIYIPLMIVILVLFALVIPERIVLRRIRRAISFYGKIIIHIFTFPFIRVKYEDRSSGDEKGPFIIVCNHRSASDAFLMACLPYECVQVVNIWPFKLPLLGWCAKMAGYLSVNEMSGEDFRKKTGKLLEEGVNIISFPEGTRSNSRQMKQFYSSIFRVAIKNKCAIVPLCISGNEQIPARGSGILQPGIIKLRRLAALNWENYKNCSPFILKNKVKDILKTELEQMDEEI
ncbi:MAG: 1-acyl-sn-glycerol-3-phosphate acyltransferase [Candidatus Omnitrophica bacterium]|nr:1-acyl-sn-glycerol-3-phosphate acyltransferase [Candidatus Omnitrophota bacterium]